MFLWRQGCKGLEHGSGRELGSAVGAMDGENLKAAVLGGWLDRRGHSRKAVEERWSNASGRSAEGQGRQSEGQRSKSQVQANEQAMGRPRKGAGPSRAQFAAQVFGSGQSFASQVVPEPSARVLSFCCTPLSLQQAFQ